MDGQDSTMDPRMMMMESRAKMMDQMHHHQNVMYTFGTLIILGFALVIIFQALILKELRRKQ